MVNSVTAAGTAVAGGQVLGLLVPDSVMTPAGSMKGTHSLLKSDMQQPIFTEIGRCLVRCVSLLVGLLLFVWWSVFSLSKNYDSKRGVTNVCVCVCVCVCVWMSVCGWYTT